MDGQGSAARFSEKCPKLALVVTFMINFGRELPISNYFLQLSSRQPMFQENLPIKEPCLESFGPTNPPTWTAYIHAINMLCISSGPKLSQTIIIPINQWKIKSMLISICLCRSSCYLGGETFQRGRYWGVLYNKFMINSFSCSLDGLLDGGLWTGELVEICGVPGSGKTQVCVVLF